MLIVSTVLQLFYLLALFHIGYGLVNTYWVMSVGDPKLMAGVLSLSIVKSLIAIVPSIFGLLLSLYITRSISLLPSWFKNYTRLMSYLWVLFVPIGTFIGLLQLRRLRNAA